MACVMIQTARGRDQVFPARGKGFDKIIFKKLA